MPLKLHPSLFCTGCNFSYVVFQENESNLRTKVHCYRQYNETEKQNQPITPSVIYNNLTVVIDIVELFLGK